MAKKNYSGSFVRRILLICFFLIIVPLLAYIGFIWDRDWRIKLNTIFTEFELKAESILSLYDQWAIFRFYQLGHFTQEIESSDVSMKFIFNDQFVCSFSTKEEMKGKSDFFPHILKQAYQKGELIFAGQNPYTQTKEIFVVKRVGDELRGLSVNAANWMSHFTPYRHFELSLVEATSQTKDFSLSQLKEWRKSVGFFEAHSLRNRHLTLILILPHTLFDVQMTLPEAEIAKIEGGNLFHSVLFFFILILLIGGIATWWLVRKMSRPFYQLAEVMHAVGEKDYTGKYQQAPFGFEINAIGERFNQMLQALLENMEEAKGRELLAKELQIGQDVQNELLPKEIPQFPGLDFGWGFLPAQEVAGDFYDLFAKDDNHLMLAIADGSGKGISACLYSLMVRSMLRSYAQSEEDLAQVITSVNHLFCQDTRDTGNFVTAWVGFYHIRDRKLTYTSAGHLPGILLHPNGELEELMTKGIALGATESQQIEVKQIILQPGSLLLLYTDGVIEAHNEKGELFGKSRLYDRVRDFRSLSSQALIDQLFKEIYQFANGASQHDDVTLLGFKIS